MWYSISYQCVICERTGPYWIIIIMRRRIFMISKRTMKKPLQKPPTSYLHYQPRCVVFSIEIS